ncbi:MAG: hypothetical protein IPH93_05600 [Saprospiraceae bacterium]|nr:hypothetical protein [Saprospiraceae bacterium]MBK9631709.1 hypothetical protein [Saprospiraceae bacterium]
MTRTKLVDSINNLVKSIEDVDLLESLYEMLKNHKSSKPGELWNSLTQTQKDEVLQAYEESEVESNLISMEEICR